MSARFVFLRVRLADRRPKPAPDGVLPLRWLIARCPEGEDEPVRHWISNLPADIPARDLVRKTTLGLDHFEGCLFTDRLTEQRTCPKAPARA
ncbi:MULTISPECIES: hypothetical protein [unclassified Streptomyces]|uniref:hypothetical protein n=1 Tax=unclassified Streptomyces TaxID=2593676 RepID=UPI00081B4B14|nr:MULTISPECIES: hypothetical protein [unclassified Streptomyces]SCE34108.1 hypothetical protein GA0115234_108122 [Streptomyces sp. DvalAA-43]